MSLESHISDAKIVEFSPPPEDDEKPPWMIYTHPYGCLFLSALQHRPFFLKRHNFFGLQKFYSVCIFRVVAYRYEFFFSCNTSISIQNYQRFIIAMHVMMFQTFFIVVVMWHCSCDSKGGGNASSVGKTEHCQRPGNQKYFWQRIQPKKKTLLMNWMEEHVLQLQAWRVGWNNE